MAAKRTASGAIGKRRAPRTEAETPTPDAARQPARERQFVDIDPWALLERLMEVPEESGHRQVKLEGDGEAPRLARAANLWGGFGASDLGPHREGLRPDGSVLGGGEVIAVEMEEVVDLIVGGEEPLHLPG